MILEIVVHKPAMKTLLKSIVIAEDLKDGLAVINSQYPVDIFFESDVIYHKALKNIAEVEASVTTRAARNTLYRNIKKYLKAV